MADDEVVIVAAARTPIGKFCGSLSSISVHLLGSIVIKEVLKRAAVAEEDVSEVIFGNVLTAGQGMNTARHASLEAGLPYTTPACTINQVCGSGLRAVAMGFQSIKCGDASIVVAGGQESMSQSAHCIHIRNGVRGNKDMVDTMYEDGLKDCIHKCMMGETAENVAKKYNISREEQDKYAFSSQYKAASAIKEEKFKKEIVAVAVKDRKGIVHEISEDEFPRPNTTVEGLSRLKPAFLPANDLSGTVTAGNSSGVNDGAAAVLLMTENEAKKRSLIPMCRIVSWAHSGVDPLLMGTGPIPAIKKAISKAGWDIKDIDIFEINEAFASPSVAVMKELGIDPLKVNVNGGSIALGHPIGASGTRILVTLAHEMLARKAKKGLAALCIGGGMGVALCVERKL